MIPVLFPSTETAFTDMSRQLADAVQCTVRQGVNGYDELSMQYPMIGAYFADLTPDALILAKPNPTLRPQPYRIYSVSRPINGLVAVQARHIAYDGRGIPVKPFKATSASDAVLKIRENALTACPFTLSTDVVMTKDMVSEVPKTFRELVATDKDSLVATYGGGLIFDWYQISHLQTPGTERGVVIRYGVDLVDVRQEENIAEVYNGVLPFWQGNQETVTPVPPSEPGEDPDPDVDPEISQETVTILGTVRRTSGTAALDKIRPLDLSEFFEEPPTAAELDDLADDWLIDNHPNIPKVSLRVSYADLGQDVRLYDTVTVQFPMLGVDTTAQVSAAEFDVLREIYTNAEIGAVQTTITDSLTDASRLRRGKLPPQRIAANSIGGGMMASGGISARALEAYAVTKDKLAALAVSTSKLQDSAVVVNKLRNGAVTTEKILDGAVTGNKVLDKAISIAKMDEDFQVAWVDVLAATAVVADTIYYNQGYGYVMNGALAQFSAATIGQLTYAGADVRWSSIKCGDGIYRWLLTADYS